MSFPTLELTTDAHGLPALKLTGVVNLVVPLASSAGHAVTTEMASALGDQMTSDFGTEMPQTWSTLEAWDNVLRLKKPSDEVARAGHFALSLYGWLAGAELAGQTPDSWLSSQIGAKPIGPGAKHEEIWTILEGRTEDPVVAIGVIADQSRAVQSWEDLDHNQPLGPRGGHQLLWPDDISRELTIVCKEVAQVASPGVWLRGVQSLDWPELLAVTKPSVLIDAYPLGAVNDWRRLKREIAGRRLGTTIWVTDDLLNGSDIDLEMAHGVAWHPNRAHTLSDWLDIWKSTAERGLCAMLLEPETASDSAWLTHLAKVTRADYLWRGRLMS